MAKLDLGPLGQLLGGLVVRAFEGAAEAVLDEAKEKIHDLDERVTHARKKVRERRARPRRYVEVDVEARDRDRH